MDIIFLNGLEISTIIGIFDWERKTHQTVIFNLEMAFDIKPAANSDDIKDTLDYKAVSERIIEFGENNHFFLVERLAEEVCQLVMTEFNVPWIKLTLNKKGALTRAVDVGVMIERGEKTPCV